MNQTMRLYGGAATRCFLGLIFFLFVANIAAQTVRTGGATQPWYMAELGRLFAVDAPYSIPIWFLAASLFLASILSATAARSGRERRKRWNGWTAICCVAMAFSVDEFVHLRQDLWSVLGESGLLHLRPVAALLLATAAFALLAIWSSDLEMHVRRRVTGGAALYLIGAFGPPLLTAVATDHTETAMVVLLSAAAFCRMIGVVLFVQGAIHHLALRSAAVPMGREWLSRSVSLLPVLFVVVALLGILGQVSRFSFGHGRLLGFVGMFDLDAEATIPAWLSSMVLLGAAAAALAIGRSESLRGERSLGWYMCSALLAWVSLDEAASVHETVSHPLQQHFDLHGFLFMAWVIPATVLLLLIAAVAIPFFLRLPAVSRRRLVIAAGVFLSGALVVEMIGGRHWDLHGPENLHYQMVVFGEETLEMLGIALLFRALVLHLRALHPRPVLVFGQAVAAPSTSRGVIGAET